MSELEAHFRISVDGKDELADFFGSSARAARTFQSTMSSSLKQTGEDITRFVGLAGRQLNSFAQLRFGIAEQARSTLEFRDSVVRLATTAGIAENQIGGLREQILGVAVATGQMKEGVAEALNAFVAKTGDIETARKNLELYARTATGTGAALSEVALIGAELSDKLKISNQAGALGILAKQSDIGAIEFKDLARQGPRILSVAATAGLSGEEGLRDIGALTQVFAKGRSGPGAAATVATEIERAITDVRAKGEKIEGLGIHVAGRSPIEVLQKIVEHFGGDMTKITRAKIFQQAALRGVGQLALDYTQHGGTFSEFERFRSVQDQGVIDEKFRRNSATGLAALNRTQARMDQSADRNLGDTAERVARMSGVAADVFDFVTAHPGTAATAGVGALFVRNLLSGGARGGAGGLGGFLGGVQRVEVVNWPGGFGGAGGLGDAARQLSTSAGTFALVANNLGAVLGAFGGGFAIGTALDEWTGASDKIANALFELLHPEERVARERAAGEAQRRAVGRTFSGRQITDEDVVRGDQFGPLLESGQFTELPPTAPGALGPRLGPAPASSARDLRIRIDVNQDGKVTGVDTDQRSAWNMSKRGRRRVN